MWNNYATHENKTLLINSNTHAAISSYTDWFFQKVLDIEYVEILVLLKVLYSFRQKQLLYDLGLDAMVSNGSPLWLTYRNRTRGMWLPVEMSSWSFPPLPLSRDWNSTFIPANERMWCAPADGPEIHWLLSVWPIISWNPQTASCYSADWSPS